MQESVDLTVDPSSPDAHVEEHFFKEGVAAEGHAREEAHAADDWSKHTRRLRLAGMGAIGTVGLVAIGLLIWGGPSSEAPATVGVVSPAAAAPAPAPPPPAPVEAPPPPPVAAAPAPAPTPTAAPAAAPAVDTAPLEQSCREAFSQKRAKDVLDNCGRAFEARPAAGELAVIVAESELDRGRATSALAWAKKAVAADPNIADAYVFIGTAEQQAGHAQAAKTAYLKYLELAPTGRFAQDLKTVVSGLK